VVVVVVVVVPWLKADFWRWEGSVSQHWGQTKYFGHAKEEDHRERRKECHRFNVHHSYS